MNTSTAQEELIWRNVFPDLYDRDGFAIRINEHNALTVADVFKCVRVRAESIALVRRKIKRLTEVSGLPTWVPDPTHYLAPIIQRRPNPLMSAYRFYMTGSSHVDTWGNWYSYIDRGKQTGKVRALWPLAPHRVRMETIAGELRYWVGDDQGHESPFFPDEILHVPGLGYDGIKGYSPVRLMMNAMGWEKSTEQYGVRFFSNGARPSGMLMTEGNQALDPDVKKALKESFEEFHRGTNNAHRVAIVEGGLKWQGLTMPNDEAQFLDTMKFHRSNLGGMYRVPGPMIGDPDPISDNNIEHLAIQFVTWAVQPSSESFSQEFERALLMDSEQDKVEIDFDFRTLLKADTETRGKFYHLMLNSGAFSQNQVLQEEGEMPFDEGNEHWMPLNMAPIKQLISMAGQAQTQPHPEQALKQSIGQELRKRFGLAYRSAVRDAIGRLMNKKPTERARAAASIFGFILTGLADGLNVEASEEFCTRYLEAMGKRAVGWEVSKIDEIASAELDRAVSAMIERSPREENVTA